MKFPRREAKNAAEAIAKEAWDRWIREEGGVVVDDITCMAVYMNSALNAGAGGGADQGGAHGSGR